MWCEEACLRLLRELGGSRSCACGEGGCDGRARCEDGGWMAAGKCPRRAQGASGEHGERVGVLAMAGRGRAAQLRHFVRVVTLGELQAKLGLGGACADPTHATGSVCTGRGRFRAALHGSCVSSYSNSDSFAASYSGGDFGHQDVISRLLNQRREAWIRRSAIGHNHLTSSPPPSPDCILGSCL